jgi:hypothetical protein
VTKVDYDQLEREFVTGTLSIRGLAAKHGMGPSAVAEQARKRDWYAKRSQYRGTRALKTYERHAEQIADDDAQIRHEMVTLARATLARWAQQLSDTDKPPVLSAKDVVEVMKQLTLLIGGATERREEKHLGLNLNVGGPGGLDPEFLRRLLEESRRHVSPALESTPGPRIEGIGED